MDGKNFDDLTRKLATGTSRRNVLRGLVGGGAALVGMKATGTLAQKQTKVTLCHATSSASNPYVQITIAKPAEVDPHINEHGDFYFNENTQCCGPKDCPGTDQCNIQSCDISGTGANRTSICGAITPRPNGTSCDDGFWCTENDVCTNGICGGTPRNCSDGYSCTTDSCDEINDVCVNTPVDSACDDGNYCTTDTCSPSAAGSDPTTGCLSVYNTLPCDDGKACTTGDVCTNGTCAGIENCTTPPNLVCYEATGTCDASGNCAYTLLDGQTCGECLVCAANGTCSEEDPACQGACDENCNGPEKCCCYNEQKDGYTCANRTNGCSRDHMYCIN